MIMEKVGYQVATGPADYGDQQAHDERQQHAMNRRAALLQAWQQHMGSDPQAVKQPLDIVADAQPAGSDWMTSAPIKGPQYAPAAPADYSSQQMQPLPPIHFEAQTSPLEQLAGSINQGKNNQPKQPDPTQDSGFMAFANKFWPGLFGNAAATGDVD
jgi:hypothetical protein